MANVLPIAHRGSSEYAPENTLSSIQKSLDDHIEYIEIDVHMTKDGEVVAIHDSTIDRTSNGEGEVFAHKLSDLKELDFGRWFDNKFENERIPTLKEVLELTGKKSKVIIELKDGNDIYPEIEKKIIEIVAKLNLSKYVILKSFSIKILYEFKRLAPEMERLYCTFGGNSWITLDNFLRFKSIFDNTGASFLQVHKYFLGESLIKEAHKRGIKVIVWDVHDQEGIDKFKRMGVDFIESNRPELVN